MLASLIWRAHKVWSSANISNWLAWFSQPCSTFLKLICSIIALSRSWKVDKIISIILTVVQKRRFRKLITILLILLNHILSIRLQKLHRRILRHPLGSMIVIKIKTSGNRRLHLEALFITGARFEQRDFAIFNLFIYKVRTVCFWIRIEIVTVLISVFFFNGRIDGESFACQTVFRFSKNLN